MSVTKETLYKLISDIPPQDMEEVADFIGYLKMKRENIMLRELSQAAESSLDFWHNDIDDEVWNDA
ncbi:DUF2281 domain-containing protein [Paenibacillus hexagrammi]|uniref:DUF2281 domain-containing protein n=1 Tax=Paenibacillus hexagrammi TaxID=2908839 RepID=A0ABY3SJD5_9BACL|nr:DUF2281 domain-containing protein [Paenibacillus sp. YPD9-1]UJF33829.1 DUF2281 domain-containing protein [Paenibacillus sp. YPD9-1]